MDKYTYMGRGLGCVMMLPRVFAVWLFALQFLSITAIASFALEPPGKLIINDSSEDLSNGEVLRRKRYSRNGVEIMERKWREGDKQVIYTVMCDSKPVIIYVKNPLGTKGLDRTFVSQSRVSRVSEWDLDGDRIVDYIVIYRAEEREFAEIFWVGSDFEVVPVASELLAKDGMRISEAELYYEIKDRPDSFKK